MWKMDGKNNTLKSNSSKISMKMENKNLISEYKREEVEEILENKLEMSKEK